MFLGLTNVYLEGIVTSERKGRGNGEKDCTNEKIRKYLRTFLEKEILKKVYTGKERKEI